MQLHAILIVALVLLAELRPAEPADPLAAVLAAWLPMGVAALLSWLATWMALRSMDRHGDLRSIARADRIQLIARMVVLGGYAAALLAYDWLALIRTTMGNLVLIDELIAMLPAILGFALLWWIHEPVDRRIRQAVLIRRLDLGLAVHPFPTRLGFVWHQIRTHLLLLLVPLLAIVAAAEAIDRIVPLIIEDEASALRWAEGLSLLAGLTIFALAPLMARFVLSVERLPDGEARSELLDVCARHGVRVRELLLWKTGGTMINAAVMGLVGRLRYVLISDALIESMSRDELVAVMAHEIGHVRRHHLPWMVVTLLGILLAITAVTTTMLLAIGGLDLGLSRQDGLTIEAVLTAGGLGVAIIAFGWISRRYERQADTFAVQHISAVEEESRRARALGAFADGAAAAGLEADETEQDDAEVAEAGSMAEAVDERASTPRTPTPADPSEATEAPVGPPRITPSAVFAMHEALERIARLNAISPRRRSWRHGSIEWRQDYLRSLVGRPVEALPIDRMVRRLKLTAAVLLVLSVAGLAAIEYQYAPAPVDPAEASPNEAIARLADQAVSCGRSATMRDGVCIIRSGTGAVRP